MIVSRSGPHLGDLVAALVDGVLGHQARERCLSHLARCAECRAEVEAHRSVKGQLAGLADPRCPDGLVDRLRDLPDAPPVGRPTDDGSAPVLPPVRLAARFRPVGASGRGPVTRGARTGAGAGVVAGAGARAGARPAGRRVRGLVATAAGVLVAFGATLATVVAVGGDARPAPVTPPVGTFSVEHSRVSDTVPGADPDAGLVDVVDAKR